MGRPKTNPTPIHKTIMESAKNVKLRKNPAIEVSDDPWREAMLGKDREGKPIQVMPGEG